MIDPSSSAFPIVPRIDPQGYTQYASLHYGLTKAEYIFVEMVKVAASTSKDPDVMDRAYDLTRRAIAKMGELP